VAADLFTKSVSGHFLIFFKLSQLANKNILSPCVAYYLNVWTIYSLFLLSFCQSSSIRTRNLAIKRMATVKRSLLSYLKNSFLSRTKHPDTSRANLLSWKYVRIFWPWCNFKSL